MYADPGSNPERSPLAARGNLPRLHSTSNRVRTVSLRNALPDPSSVARHLMTRVDNAKSGQGHFVVALPAPMARFHASCPGFLSAAMAACLSMPLHAQSTTFDATVALSSQLVDRGQAITGDTPILQGAVSWMFPTGAAASRTLPSGWSLGLSGSTELRSPNRMAEALLQASRYWSLSSDWQIQVSLLYYRYPGSTDDSSALDRAEAGIDWSYRDVLTLALSAIHVIGAKGPLRGAADINLQWPLARHFSLSAGAGITQSLGASYYPYHHVYPGAYSHAYPGHAGAIRANHYGYGHVGLLWSDGPWRMELDRIVAAPETQQPWANPGASPWVATISRSF